MSDWRSQHYDHTASTTRTILQQGLFSDAEVHVQGVVFHCHRYVLAQSSQFFFSRFTNALDFSSGVRVTEDNTDTCREVVKRECISDVGNSLEINDREVTDIRRQTCSVKGAEQQRLRQEQLLESLGKPARKEGDIQSSEKRDDDFPTSRNTGDSHNGDDLKNTGVVSVDFSHKSSPGTESRFLPVATFVKQDKLTKNSKEIDRSPGNQKATIRLDNLSAETFGIILDAIYLGIDPVTPDNALDLYKATVQLRISSVVERCQETVSALLHQRKVDAEDIFLDPEMMESSLIAQSTLDVLLTDFNTKSSRREWFLNLSPQNLCSVLSDPRLNVRHEDEVYRALTNWYEHNPWSRESFMAEALTHIRLANLSRQVLVDKILPHPLCQQQPSNHKGVRNHSENGDREGYHVTHVKSESAWKGPIVPGMTSGRGRGDDSDVSLSKVVLQAVSYHLLPDRRHDELLPVAIFRPSQAFERVLIVLGDQSDKSYAYSFARRAWFKLAPPPKALGLGVAACTHGDDLYVNGGDKAMTEFWRYRASTNKWKKLPDMNVGRRSHCCVAVGDHIYVLGGKDDKHSPKSDTLASVERFNIQDKGQGWVMVTAASLPVPVRSMAHAVSGGRIYLFGGRTNGYQQTVDTIQCTDTTTERSTIVGHLPSPSCLTRPFVANKVTYLLETNGDIMRFQPQSLKETDKEGTISASGRTPSSTPTQHTQGKANGASRKSLHSFTNHRSQEQQDLKTEMDTYSSIVQHPVAKAGSVVGLGWKWYGAARDHRGTLYVIAGELPGKDSAAAADLSINGSDDITHVLSEVRYVCPERMEMCYVHAHMGVPKSFLVERVV